MYLRTYIHTLTIIHVWSHRSRIVCVGVGTRDKMERCGRGGQRANQAGEARFSLRGWGFGLGSPAAPLYSNTPPHPPTPSLRCCCCCCCYHFPYIQRGGGVRREGWSWINTMVGWGGTWTTMARAYAAPSRDGFKDENSLRQFIFRPFCQRFCWYSSSWTSLYK